jgi:hypothetical protein
MSLDNNYQPIIDRIAKAAQLALRKEISDLISIGFLDQYQMEHCKKNTVLPLTRVLQEHVIRYLILKEFYSDSVNHSVRFKTEVGGIDIVLYEAGRKIAFEIKRWQSDKEGKEIVKKDVSKLRKFISGANGGAFELIVVINESKKGESEYISDFNYKFKNILKCLDLQVISHEEFPNSRVVFTICVYIAEVIV